MVFIAYQEDSSALQRTMNVLTINIIDTICISIDTWAFSERNFHQTKQNFLCPTIERSRDSTGFKRCRDDTGERVTRAEDFHHSDSSIATDRPVPPDLWSFRFFTVEGTIPGLHFQRNTNEICRHMRMRISVNEGFQSARWAHGRCLPLIVITL